MIERKYQTEAIQAVIDDWSAGHLDVLLCLPTGGGKTFTAIKLLEKAARPNERILWIAHRQELIAQPLERLQKSWPNPTEIGIVKASKNDVSARFVLGSVQTVCRPNRMAQLLNAGSFDYLVTDESHHSPSKSYLEIYKALRSANPKLRHVGLTATPKRTDGKSMRNVFDKISYQMNIIRAIREGWLVPPRAMQIETGVDISGVKVSHGDFVPGDLADVLDANRWHEKVVSSYLEHAEGKQALAFTPTVATSKRLVEEFLEHGIVARHVDGTTPKDERRKIVNAFRSREIQVLSNCAVFGEGADFPSVEVILMARPTQSHVYLTQAIGRGLRIYPGKDHCLVLMFATTGARILTIFDLGESKELKKAKKAAEELAIEGVSGAIPLFDEDKIEGVGLYAKVVSLFSSSTAAWYRDGAEFSLGLGEHEGHQRTLFITPPNGDDEWHLWGLGRKGDRGHWRARELSSGPDIDEMMLRASDIVERRGMPILSKKDKAWRKKPATSGQKKYARRWAPAEVVEKLLRGAAAKLISHGVARDTLVRQGFL